MRRVRTVPAWVLAVVAILFAAPGLAWAEGGVVRAVLFHTPSCSHCNEIIFEYLPPLQAQYGSQLEILQIDISRSSGKPIYEAAIERLQISEERQGYPSIIIGDRVLLGSEEISSELPGLIEEHLAAGGVDWPDIPGLDQAASLAPAAPESWWQRALRDPLGNGLAVLVLLGLIASLIAVIRPYAWQERLAGRLPWARPVVALLGLAVAGYLAYVETAQREAFCGPVGDCNAVQQSEFVLLLGVLPVGLFGVLGYLAILASLAYARWGWGILARLAPLATFLMTAFGVAFSAYLTFLEPFVIGATCSWCLTSAVCMALLLLFSAGPGWAVLSDLPWTLKEGSSS